MPAPLTANHHNNKLPGQIRLLLRRLTIICLPLCLLSFALKAEVPDFILHCMDCHGENGVSEHSDVPTIAGLSAAYQEASLYAYKDGQRPAIPSSYRRGDLKRPKTDMKIIADKLDDEQITYIGLYFAAQRFVPAKQNFNPLLVEQGEKIHQSQCRRCHRQGGSRASDDAGLLAGQWSQYLKDTMKFYLDGTRETERKMKIKLDRLTEQQWQALLAYYASQQ